MKLLWDKKIGIIIFFCEKSLAKVFSLRNFPYFFWRKADFVRLSMTNNFSKKGVFSRISGWVDDFFLSILKLEGVEADEFEGDESDIERLLMFFGCCCDDVSMADSNKFS